MKAIETKEQLIHLLKETKVSAWEIIRAIQDSETDPSFDLIYYDNSGYSPESKKLAATIFESMIDIIVSKAIDKVQPDAPPDVYLWNDYCDIKDFDPIPHLKSMYKDYM